MAKKAFIVVLVLLALSLSGACATPPAASGGGKTTGGHTTEGTVAAGSPDTEAGIIVVVTRDFGRELVLERHVTVEPDTSALQILKEVATVETKYSGRFVNSINGIAGENDEMEDWFFYINGIAAKAGADEYVLGAGDIQHWDFRDWSYRQFVPAVIGDYPQPFRSGHADNQAVTMVVYEEPFAGEAESLVEILKSDGISPVSTADVKMLSEEARGQNNLIIIAAPENGLISEMNKAYKQLGLYAFFEDNALIVLDAEGKLSDEYGSGSGLIQSTQNPWNPKGVGAGENVAWMVTGTDADGVRNAAEVLINSGDELRYAFAVVVSGSNIIRIP